MKLTKQMPLKNPYQSGFMKQPLNTIPVYVIRLSWGISNGALTFVKAVDFLMLGEFTGPKPRIYTSLPRFRVSVSGSPPPAGTDVFSQPRVFVLQSSRAKRGHLPRFRGFYGKNCRFVLGHVGSAHIEVYSISGQFSCCKL